MPAIERNRATVRRLVDEVINGERMDVVDELYTREKAAAAKRWIEPFRRSFRTYRWRSSSWWPRGIASAGRFLCSGTHRGEWRGHAPSGRRFERVDEVYFFSFRDGRIADAWGIEDTPTRLRQLGLDSP